MCFNYGKPGHKIWECSNKKQQLATRPQHQGRVFTFNTEESTQSIDLTQGEGEMNDNTLIMLYDSGTTHSFIFLDYENILKLPISKLP